jgi:ABC-type glycerol-3-phosphate transport system substrate-binding protein
MNFQFYLPLNTAGASSVVNQIFASYLYQSVDDIKQAFYRTAINEFGENYIESNFDSVEAQEAFEFWCSFYTDYSFPLSASFVNRFRSGETPIGIVGYDIYNTLAVSAPEIRGKWKFALLPGTEELDANGNIVIDHQGAASGMGLTMMGTTDNPYEAWAFMDWFTSADTQVNYAREIEAILGAAARHNTANVAAFTRLAWTEEEKDILMEQWKYTVGVPEVAGGYYTGRNLENAFREVVNNNYNPRQILADYILTINSEIDRKREEFGLSSSTKKADANKWG